jgi:hypothetical protein
MRSKEQGPFSALWVYLRQLFFGPAPTPKMPTLPERDPYREPQLIIKSRFMKHSNGSVTDQYTSLNWAGSDNGHDISYVEALWYAQSYPGEGWRLPTIEELKGLYEEMITTHQGGALIELSQDWLWAMSTEAPEALQGPLPENPWAFLVNFENGYIFKDLRSARYACRVLLVRRSD